MKAHWLRNTVLTIMIGVMYAVPAMAQKASAKTLTRKEALIVAESTEEAALLYTMYNGRLKNCIEKEVIKPCESDWVSCIENAWVVQFTIGDVCYVEQDGRLGLTVLIDSLTGRVLSRYPEAGYFKAPRFCLDDSDCLCGKETGEPRKCYNFISAQVEGVADFQCRQCRCVQNECVPGDT